VNATYLKIVTAKRSALVGWIENQFCDIHAKRIAGEGFWRESKTATRLVREWIDLSLDELKEDWALARAGKEIKKIAPLE
jgi:hypothetical protein